jgi:hypothetical protein
VGLRLLVPVAAVIVLAGCGSSSHVDGGGFTSTQRTAAQAALDRLQKTGLPRSVVAISYQTGQAPVTCIVLPTAADDRFQLVIAWKPDRADYASIPQSVLVATIGSSSRDVHYRVTSFGGGPSGAKEPASVAAAVVRASLAKPAEQCQVLENSRLRLVPAR